MGPFERGTALDEEGCQSNGNRLLPAVQQGSRGTCLFSLRACVCTKYALELELVYTLKFRRAFVKEPSAEAGLAPTKMTEPAEKALKGAC